MSVVPLQPLHRLVVRRNALVGAVSNATGSSLLTVWLLLQPSYGVAASDALAKVNAPATQQDLARAIAAALQVYSPPAGLSVSVTAASEVALPPSIFVGPLNGGNVPVAPGSVMAPGSLAGLAPGSLAGLVIGLALSAAGLVLLWAVVFTRASGGKPPCRIERCGSAVVQIATCCGRWPVRKRRPATSVQPKVVAWRDKSSLVTSSLAPAPVTSSNPIQNALALRSIDAAAGPLT